VNSGSQEFNAEHDRRKVTIYELLALLANFKIVAQTVTTLISSIMSIAASPSIQAQTSKLVHHNRIFRKCRHPAQPGRYLDGSGVRIRGAQGCGALCAKFVSSTSDS